MAMTITKVKTSPINRNKYKIGKQYKKEIGNHLILMKCIAKNNGLFFFEDIREID